MQIRNYRPEDLAPIVALFRETVRRINRRDYSEEQVRAWAPDVIDVGAYAARFVGRFAVVAEDGGRVVGFTDLEGDGHVDRFYVHADHQRRGIGRAMMGAVEAEARRLGCDRLSAEVSLTARPFFERRGFSVLCEQVVAIRGVELVNYRMAKRLSSIGLEGNRGNW